ncbi:hypothetical protein CLOP_g9010 [Closterium sp. NIES-67]|nr:hypothetical protein CLOP_g9010 [Closterium sp. NIES-67]
MEVSSPAPRAEGLRRTRKAAEQRRHRQRQHQLQQQQQQQHQRRQKQQQRYQRQRQQQHWEQTRLIFAAIAAEKQTGIRGQANKDESRVRVTRTSVGETEVGEEGIRSASVTRRVAKKGKDTPKSRKGKKAGNEDPESGVGQLPQLALADSPSSVPVDLTFSDRLTEDTQQGQEQVTEAQQVTDSEHVTEAQQVADSAQITESDQAGETAQVCEAEKEKEKLPRPRSSSAKRKPQDKGKQRERQKQEQEKQKQEQEVGKVQERGERQRGEQQRGEQERGEQQREEQQSRTGESQKLSVRPTTGQTAVLTAEQLRKHTERITGQQSPELTAANASRCRPNSPGLSSNVSVRQLRSIFEQSKTTTGPLRKSSKSNRNSKGSNSSGGNSNAVRRSSSIGTTDTDSSDALANPSIVSSRMKREGSLRAGSILGPGSRASPRRKAQSAGLDLVKSPHALKSQVQRRQQGKQAALRRPNSPCQVPRSAEDDDSCEAGEGSFRQRLGGSADRGDACIEDSDENRGKDDDGDSDGLDGAPSREAAATRFDATRRCDSNGLYCSEEGRRSDSGEGSGGGSRGGRATRNPKQVVRAAIPASDSIEMDTDREGGGGGGRETGMTFDGLEGEEDMQAETVVLVIGTGNTGLASGVVMAPGRARRKREGVGGRAAVQGKKGRGGAVGSGAAGGAQARKEWTPKGRKARKDGVGSVGEISGTESASEKVQDHGRLCVEGGSSSELVFTGTSLTLADLPPLTVGGTDSQAVCAGAVVSVATRGNGSGGGAARSRRKGLKGGKDARRLVA